MSVTGEHEDGKSNDDVKFFRANGINFHCFPKNIAKFFKNIERVTVFDSKITSLGKYDLKSLGTKLKQFYAYNNKIEVIDGNTFEANLNLEIIHLGSNQMKFAGEGAFRNLLKLRGLWFFDNPCHNGYATDHDAVLNLVTEIESLCNKKPGWFKELENLTSTALAKIPSEREIKIY